MKRTTPKFKNFLKFSYLLVFFSIIYSCQTEELSTTATAVSNSKPANNALKANMLAAVSTAVSSGDCAVDCISADTPYFATTDQQIASWGGRNNDQNSKTVAIEYYNTATDFVLKVKSTAGWSDLKIDGTSYWTLNSPVAANEWGTITIPLSSGWKACDVKSFSLQITGNGPPVTFDVSYTLFGVCTTCETSFTGEALSCDQTREAVYTFIADTDISYFKIQGGLTNFTGADAIVTVTGGTGITITQSIPGGSSNRTIKVEGGISKCTEVTIRITWNSSNSGGTVTGAWSIKDGNGAEIASPILGLECN